MQFNVEKRHRKKAKHSRSDFDLALKFAKKVDNDLKDFLKSAVLFGSAATKKPEQGSDIDVLLIIDDATYVITKPLAEAYRVIVEKHAVDTSLKLHISTMKTTSFWENVKKGDPVLINVLRDGLVLIDKGIFSPVQVLLEQGRLRPTKESIWQYYGRAEPSIINAKSHILQACVDLYWAAVDAAHAALMSVGATPPSPLHVPDMMREYLVRKGLLPEKYPVMMRELYDLSKHVQHRDIKEITGAQFDNYLRETVELVNVLKEIVRANEHNHPQS